jgi:DNA-binding transcriptional ArsR family regulator
MTFSSLLGKLQLAQSDASQHLAILRRAGLVSTKREAKYIFYAVNINRLEQLHSIASKLITGKI